MPELTYYIEIPIKIFYTFNPEERMTMTYPGCPAHITVDCVTAPPEEEIYKIIDTEADAIEMECWEDHSKGVDDGI